MTENPTFVYAMIPRGNSSFRNFFETGPIHELLEHPGELRYAGWDLQTRDRAKIIKGEYLEVKSRERKLVRLYEDGSLIAKVAADNSFLGWGQSDDGFKQSPRLNPVAITEFSYNFVSLGARLVKLLSPLPRTVNVRVEIRNAFFEDSKLYLLPYGTNTYEWMFNDERHHAPEKSMLREIEVSAEELISRPEVVAYVLVERIYAWFGVSAEKIPYTSSDGQKKFIDVEKIKGVKN